MKIDATMKSSALIVGYKILKEIRDRKTDHISIYDVSEVLRKSGIYGSRPLIIGLCFLYSIDIIYFEEAIIWVKKSKISA